MTRGTPPPVPPPAPPAMTSAAPAAVPRPAATTPRPPSALYDALAPVYDRWQSADGMTPFSLVTLAKLLPTLARHGRDRVGPEAGPSTPDRSFVDLGCGTGELLLGLGRAHPGWRLVGLDGSARMIDCARHKPGGERIDWRVGPLAAPPLPPAGTGAGADTGAGSAGFDAAGCFYDTLNHLIEPGALAAMVGVVAAALRPGGLFVFDATNAIGFDRWWRGNRSWRGAGWSVTVETRYDPVQRLGHAEVTVSHDGVPVTAQLTERHFGDDELRAALSDAALDVVVAERWSPFDIDAPGKTWWITRKRPS